MLPPLNSLRAFEAAARLKSFKRAADELGVTPAAISHQVKALEEFLGVELFRRRARGLEITPIARDVQPLLREGFESLQLAVDRIAATRGKRSLTVSVTPSFASMWLVPRLEAFDTAHPGIDILIDATNNLADFDRDPVDVAVRYGAGNYPGLYVRRLSGDVQFPVCSPELIDDDYPLRVPEDLRHHTLLHFAEDDPDDIWPSWRMWLRAAGVEGIDPDKGPRFRQEDMVIKAAIDGQGVALANELLVADEIAEGWLVRPFEQTVSAPDRFGFYFVCREVDVERPAVKAFHDWMFDEMARSEARNASSGEPAAA